MRKKVALLLSGGVDSSVALAMLASSDEYEVSAYYLKIWLEDDFRFLGECPWEEDLSYAREVCERFDVKLNIVPLQTVYWDLVVSNLISELQRGYTPSPDILCNQRVKFGAFLDYLGDQDVKIASGHYARISHHENTFNLERGVDAVKDQTYFLSYLSQKQISRLIFPLGELTKQEVRSYAQSLGLPNRDRADSQGICFLGKIKYNDFVKCHLGEKKGEIRERSTGRFLGNHKGYWFYTIGQRRGLGLHGGPWFVSRKDVDGNIIYVDHIDALEGALTHSFAVGKIHWISLPPVNRDLEVKVRHGQKTIKCSLEGTGPFKVLLGSGDTGIAPGQYAVFYQGDHCLGSGVIGYDTLDFKRAQNQR